MAAIGGIKGGSVEMSAIDEIAAEKEAIVHMMHAQQIAAEEIAAQDELAAQELYAEEEALLVAQEQEHLRQAYEEAVILSQVPREPMSAIDEVKAEKELYAAEEAMILAQEQEQLHLAAEEEAIFSEAPREPMSAIDEVKAEKELACMYAVGAVSEELQPDEQVQLEMEQQYLAEMEEIEYAQMRHMKHIAHREELEQMEQIQWMEEIATKKEAARLQNNGKQASQQEMSAIEEVAAEKELIVQAQIAAAEEEEQVALEAQMVHAAQQEQFAAEEAAALEEQLAAEEAAALEEQLAAEEAAALEEQPVPLDLPENVRLMAGDRVKVHGVPGPPDINGLCGTLVQMTDKRWQVRLDGRGKWIVKPENLERLPISKTPLKYSSMKVALNSKGFSAKDDMSWDAPNGCWRYELDIGQDGFESFQLLANGDWKTVLHPDKDNASPHIDHKLVGPDEKGHDLNWTIGAHARDRCSKGARYEIRLFVLEDGTPRQMSWSKMATKAPLKPPEPQQQQQQQQQQQTVATKGEDQQIKPEQQAPPQSDSERPQPDVSAPALRTAENRAVRTVPWRPTAMPRKTNAKPLKLPKFRSVWIAGSWNDYKPQEMALDKVRNCYFSRFKMVEEEAGFQLILDKEWAKCLHPDQDGATPYFEYRLRGPDNRGHGCNWTIGRHALDRSGTWFEVRMFLTNDGSLNVVDWVALNSEDDKLEIQEPETPSAVDSILRTEPHRLPKFELVGIAGSWDDWQQPYEMLWDANLQTFYFRVPIGEDGEESFQILLDGNWDRVIHPDRNDACPHMHYKLQGPDNKNHDRNWTIGKHRLERGSQGKSYEIRMKMTDDGSIEKIDWIKEDSAPK